MKKRLVCLLMACVFVLGLVPETAFAAEVVETGSCGDNVTYTLYDDGLLAISGTGKMRDYIVEDGSPWYALRSNIKQVEISNGVTSVGKYTFSWCRKLTSVNIPSSVTSIGEGVFGMFGSCVSLTSIEVDMNNPVYSSEGGVLFNKSKSQLIRYSVGKAGMYSIPNSVTNIGKSAFFGCSSLTSVNIPNSVTSIGNGAFTWCTSLTSINIPSSVTSIGEGAFYYCSSLTSVSIPSSVTSIGDDAFCGRSSLTDVYYGGSEAQWNAITSGDDVLPTSATIHYNRHGIPTKVAPVPAGKYCIHAVDETGKDLQGVKVTWTNNGSTTAQTTPADGKVYFNLATVSTPVIKAELDAYATWTNANSNWEKNEDRYEKIILYSGQAAKYKLSSARYSNSSMMTNSTDLLTKTKKLNLKNDGNLVGDLDFGNFYLSCSAADITGVVRYELWQKDKKIAETTSGWFGQLSVTKFTKGGGCFIRVVTSDNKQVDTNINLEFASNTVVKENQIAITGSTISFEVSDDIPYVGGSTLDFDLPIRSKVTAIAGDNKLLLGFNVNLAGGKSEEEQLKSARDVIRKAARAKSLPTGKLSGQDQKIFESLIKDKNGIKFFKSGQINFLGYAEANWGSSTATGQLLLQFKINAAKAEYNTWVVVVPVTVHIKLGLAADVIGEITYDWEKATLLGNMSINPSATLTAFGGVGVSEYVGVGAYGSAKLAAEIGLLGTPKGVQKVDLTGELGVKAYLGDETYERPFAHNTWNLYAANNVGTMSLQSADEPWTAGLYDASQYELADLSYLSQESGWHGGGGVQLMDAEASTQLTALITDTYRNARPVMAATSDALYAAFVRADQESGARYVVVTKFNGSTWSEPARIDANAVLDDSPALCADGSGNVWLAYARTGSGWTDKASLSDYARNQEIVVGKLDSETMQLTNTRTYAPETGYVHSQTLSVVDGVPVLAWADTAVTDDNSVLAPETGSIRYAPCSGGTWGDAATLTSAAPDQLAVGEYRGQTAVAYTVDGTLSCVTASKVVTKLADEVTGRVMYGTLPGAAASAFIWNEENTLKASDGTTVAAEGITREYAVVGNSIYYSAADENSANLKVLQYQDNAWGLPIQLTGDARYLENLSAARLNDQDYVFGMSTAVTISENAVDDAKNLVWSRVMPVSDLRLEDASYDVENAAAGAETTVTLTVTNAGDHAVNSFDIFVSDRKVETKACSLAPGESMETEITIACPSELMNYTVEVAETGKDDYHPDDNAQVLTMGYADAVVDMEYHQIGTQKALVAAVTNEGITPASGSLLFYDKNGEVVAESTFTDLAAGDVAVAQYEFSADAANIIDGDVSVMAVVDQEEYYTFNNEASLFVSKPYQPTEIREATITNGSATAQVFCNEDDTGASVCCAFYKDGGQMIESKTAALTADQPNELTYNLPDGTKTVKWFVMDGEGKPICESIGREMQ